MLRKILRISWKKAIYDDKLNVKRDFERVAKSDLNKASNSAKEMISSFTKGVNLYNFY